MKIVDCIKLKERKDLRKKWKWKERGRRERRKRKETKRNKQECNSVFLACVSIH